MQLVLSHHLSVTSCRAFPQPQRVWRNMFFQIGIRSQTCSFDTGEDAKISMTGFDIFCDGSVAWCFLRIFSSLRQSCPSNLVREKTIVLFVSDHRTSLLLLVCDDWNYMSLLFENCPCAFHWKHSPTFLSTWAFFPFLTLGDCSSFHNFVLECEVSSSHHLINMKFYRRLQS